MLLAPKKNKYMKSFSGKKITKKSIVKKAALRFSNICIIANQSGFLTNFQIESTRRFLRRFLKKKAQLFLRLVMTRSITKKPNEVRLGKGKANVKYWAYFAKKGEILWEIRVNSDKRAMSKLNDVSSKLPMKSFVLNRQKRWIL